MKLFFRFCIFISFLLLLYTIYRSEIYWRGENRDYYYIYWIILIALTIFFSITLQLNHNIQKYVTIVLLSVVVSLYLFEGYHHCLRSSCFENYKKINSSYYDKRSPVEIYNDLKNNNKNLTISIGPLNHILTKTSDDIFPLAGISNSNTIHCNENGYYSIYQSDRYGFNNPDEEWDSNNIEYLLVGDSYTHGACVNRPDDIASVLRNLSKKNVINLGYEGNGTLLEYATLREYLKPGVKKILWLYYENDLGGLFAELKSPILIKYLKDLNYSQDLKSKQNEIDNLLLLLTKTEENKFFSKKKNLRFLKTIKLYETRFFFKVIFFEQYVWAAFMFKIDKWWGGGGFDEFRNIIQLANDLSIKNNSTLYFVYLPGHKDLADGKENYAKSQLVKITSELNIPFIDIENDVFKKEANPLKLFPFERFGHYNVEGYKKTALKIYEKTK